MQRAMITPTEDFCGKIIFENETVRRYFISAVLKISVENISSTRILDPFLRRFRRESKEGILDVLVELWDGRKINIEIQVAEIKYWDRRSIFYLSKLYIRGFNRGGNYRSLKSCINISILNFDYLKTVSCHTVFRLRDKKGNDYSNALEIHIIELGKLQKEKECYLQNQTTETIEDTETDAYDKEVEEWIAFFKCRTEEEVKALKLRTKNPGIKEAIEELLTVNASTVWRARHEARLKDKRDREAREEFLIDKGIEQGIEKGIEKGIEQGIEQGKAEGKAEGKADVILEFLHEIGTVPLTLETQVYKEQDMDVLMKWVKLAAHSTSIEEFMEKYLES